VPCWPEKGAFAELQDEPIEISAINQSDINRGLYRSG